MNKIPPPLETWDFENLKDEFEDFDDDDDDEPAKGDGEDLTTIDGVSNTIFNRQNEGLVSSTMY